jgi:hypothetical protein
MYSPGTEAPREMGKKGQYRRRTRKKKKKGDDEKSMGEHK